MTSRRYRFNELDIGQSFTVPADEAPAVKTLRNLCLYWQRKLPGRSFQCHLQRDGSIRVDRVKPRRAFSDYPVESTPRRKTKAEREAEIAAHLEELRK